MFGKSLKLSKHAWLGIQFAFLAALPTYADVTIDQLLFTRNESGYTVSRNPNFSSPLEGALIIPEIYNGLPITQIGEYAFSNCQELTQLSIPNSVTVIGSNAFSSCNYITITRMSNSLVEIRNNAFSSCENIDSFNFPNTLISIGEYAFSNCRALKSINLPLSLKKLEANAFSWCNKLETINIPSSISAIPNNCFAGCQSLKEITLPHSITSIGEFAFSSCYRLNNIAIPNSVTIIGRRAFEDTDIYCLIIPLSVTKLGDYIFGENAYGKKLAYPENLVTNVGDAFGIPYPKNAYIKDGLIFNQDMTKLYFVDVSYKGDLLLSNSLIEIGEYAFSNCYGIKDLLIPPSVKKIVSSAFWDMMAMPIIDAMQRIAFPEEFSNIIKHDEYDYGYNHRSALIPYPAECIEENNFIFSQDKSILYFAPRTLKGEVKIPTGLKEIGNSAFEYCDSIEYLRVIPTVPPILGDNNFTNIYENTPLEVTCGSRGLYANAQGWKEFINIINSPIGDGESIVVVNEQAGDLIKNIDRNKLEKYTSLKISGPINSTDLILINRMANLYSIDMGEATVESSDRYYYQLDGQNYYTANDCLGSYWFNAIAPVNVKLPQVTTLAPRALYNNAIETLTIPGTIQTIETSALAGNRLKTLIIEYGENPISCQGGNYLKDQPLDTLILHRPIDTAIFAGCKSLKNLSIGEEITEIGENWFNGCTGLIEVDLPSSISTIGNYAFQYCTELNSISMPEGINSIGRQAFQSCTKLGIINLPESLTTIGAGAFRDCTNLDSIAIPQFITVINDETFSNCTNLKTIVLPNSIQSILNNAFSGCSSLEGITIPNSVQTIGSYAFGWCTGLKSIIVPNSVEWLYGNPFSGCTELVKSAYPDNLVNPFSNGISVAYPKTDTFIRDGWIFNNDSTALYFAPYTLSETYSIPEKIEIIGNSAFNHCSNLKAIAVPTSLKQIGNDAFSNCDSLQNVNITDLHAWCTIYFNNLESNPIYTSNDLQLNGISIVDIEIPDGIFNINDCAFAGANRIRKVILNKDVKSIGIESFKDCAAIESIISYPTTPPEILNESFDERLYTQAELIVPEESELDYFLHAIWGKFLNIKGVDLSGIEEPEINDINLHYDLFNLQGIKVDTQNISPGIYLKRQGSQVTKVYIN